MASIHRRALIMLGACLAAGQVIAQPTVPSTTDTVLVHRFTIPPGETWGTVSIRMSAGGWHLGSVDGAKASQAQLIVALGHLVGIELGGRCAGWTEGPTVYPCAFSLRAIDLAGTVAEHYGAIAVDWEVTRAASAAADAGDHPAQHASDAAPPRRLGPRHFVRLRLPASYLGDKRRAIGGLLRFHIRTVSNMHAASQFDRTSGLVILRARVPVERS